MRKQTNFGLVGGANNKIHDVTCLLKEGGAGARLSLAASIRDGAGREVCKLFGHSVHVFTPFR